MTQSDTLSLPEMDAKTLTREVVTALTTGLGITVAQASNGDWFRALSLALRARVIAPWMAAEQASAGKKRVAYLSMEFLMGRLLGDSALNLGLETTAREAMASLGVSFDEITSEEPDAALGNGGLGRLAACFLDSLATMGVPGTGYGLRYEHGLFTQSWASGRQAEAPETWLADPAPWMLLRAGLKCTVGFGGWVEQQGDARVWHPDQCIEARAHDMPVTGWQGKWVTTLRLWEARAVPGFDLPRFSCGDHIGAAQTGEAARALTRVLYPDDSSHGGKELRLKQEYLLVAASLSDIVSRHLAEGRKIETLADFWAIQMNDTHPALAVPELLRVLIDDHGLGFDRAWDITRATLSYTNHTLMPEALERWSTWSMGRILPRHMELIETVAGLSVRAPEHTRIIHHDQVHMGNLAFIGAHKVNGVSALHTDLMRETVFADLDRLHPNRIVNQTNGVTPRRWLALANPGLGALLTEVVGDGWQADLDRIKGLEAHLADPAMLDRLGAVKRTAKARFGDLMGAQGISLNPDALFDVQVKRIHEYKRQLLNILEVIAVWQGLKDGTIKDAAPRVRIFGGKAAPGYFMAKEIIALIHDVARVVNTDPATREMMQVVYPANYNVSMAQVLIPAADLSEQISTAGTEASGTGNMKFAMNGALTIGTLDGANVEIREHVGAENFFLFGMTTPQAQATLSTHGHAARAIAASPRLQAVITALESGAFGEHGAVVDALVHYDPYACCSDFDSYFTAQREVDRAYADQGAWQRMAGLNIARMGYFSSDRTIRGYMEDIWGNASQL
jgi:starch phosphorylase